MSKQMKKKIRDKGTEALVVVVKVEVEIEVVVVVEGGQEEQQ